MRTEQVVIVWKCVPNHKSPEKDKSKIRCITPVRIAITKRQKILFFGSNKASLNASTLVSSDWEDLSRAKQSQECRTLLKYPSQRQEGGEFEAGQGYRLKPSLKIKLSHLMIIQEPIDWKLSTQMPQAPSFTWPCFLFCNHDCVAFSYSELPVVDKLLWFSNSSSSSHLL